MKLNNPQVAFTVYQQSWAPENLEKETVKNGDDSFLVRLSKKQQEELPKLPSGFEYSIQSAVVLAVKSVEKHTDSQVGELPNTGTSLGIVKIDDTVSAMLYANGTKIEVKAGMWVLFDDKYPHWLEVKGEGKVYAVSVQVYNKELEAVEV